MMKKYDAVVAGYTCIDLTPGFKKDTTIGNISDLFVPGKLVEVDGLDFVLGGAVPNTGLAMKKFKKKVFLNGLIGNDFIGRLAKDWLKKNEVHEGIKMTHAANTAYSIVLAPPGIDRIFLESPGCNKIFNTTFINFEAIAQSRIFHFGYPPLLRQFYINNGHELSDLFLKVNEAGAVTSLDFSLPDPESESGKVNWAGILEKTLPFVDIFAPSLEETLQVMMPEKYAEMRCLSGDSDFVEIVPTGLIREVGRLIINSGVKILMLKAGARGAYLITGDVSSLVRKTGLNLSVKDWSFREFWCKAYCADESKIVNTSGAGDTSNAAFLCAILDGESPEMAAMFAAVAGRNKLYSHDNYDGLEEWQVMQNEITAKPCEIMWF